MFTRILELKNFILVGIGIISILLCFLFFYKNNHTEPKTVNESTQNNSIDNNEDMSEDNTQKAITDSPDVTDVLDPVSENEPIPVKSEVAPEKSSFPLHTNVTATVFWVGEPKGGGSSEDNALSAWDDSWQKHFGCFDDPAKRNGYHPKGCTPKENPFYFDLPYNDFDWEGVGGRRENAYQVIPWAKSKNWKANESMLKNRWIKIIKDSNVCYAQWEDAGPYVYNDARYVFGKKDERPKNKKANSAGMDVSPAVRDCLDFKGINNADNKVSWEFVEIGDVPSGPWKNIITTSGTYWK